MDDTQRSPEGSADDSTSSSLEPEASVSRHDESEPDGGYGWVCVLSMLFITANTWGVNGVFGVYLAHYLSNETFAGTTEITYAFIGGLSISQITFIAPLVTYISKRLGAHTTLSIGIVLETSALVAASFATEVWHLFLTQGIIFGRGCSFLYVGSVGIVPQWFNRLQSLATALAAGGSGLGGLAYSLGSEAMIQTISLQWSFRITAILTCIMNSVCMVLMKDRNKQIAPNQKAFDFSLLKQYPFLLVIAWAYFSTLGYTLILFSLPDNALSIGLSAQQGAIAGAMANLGMAVGRPIVGYFSDRIGRINMVILATFACSLYCLCIWTSADSYPALLVFSILAGTVCGTYWAMIAPVLTEVLGIENLPASLSIVWTVIILPTTFAEPIALCLRREHAPKYLSVQLFTGFVCLAGAGCMLFLRIWAIKHLIPETSKQSPNKSTAIADGDNAIEEKKRDNILHRMEWERV